MELSNVTFFGPEFEEDLPIVAALPDNLIGLLRQINGFILLEGGLHVRGVCSDPEWHSLNSVMNGPRALHALYPEIRDSDIPFAQDCVADQYVMRNRVVHKLEAETGSVRSAGLSLPEFLSEVEKNPVEFLGMQPLQRFWRDGGALQPGQVLNVYPPFCTKEAADGVALKAVSINEAIDFLADFARQISGLTPGQQFQIEVV